MDWNTAKRVPWGLLLLFGGGLSLAASFEQTGLADYVAAQGQGLENLPVWVLVLCIATVVVFLSEIASNVATATTVVPVLAALAIGAGLAPVPLVLAACFAASCGFMLPVATPPNAIAYGTGRVTAGQMAQGGIPAECAGYPVYYGSDLRDHYPVHRSEVMQRRPAGSLTRVHPRLVRAWPSARPSCPASRMPRPTPSSLRRRPRWSARPARWPPATTTR